MWFDENAREWKAHPECKCGQFADWTERGINRPCYCMCLSPLDKDGNVLDYELINALRASIMRPRKPTGA